MFTFIRVDLRVRLSAGNNNNNNNNRFLLRQYPRRSRSVARQNQWIKQTRNRKTMRESSMD